jgi:hypothetical protein
MGPGSAVHREERCTASGTRGENATAADIAADGCSLNPYAATYFGYLNSGAAFSASLVVFIDASHLSFFWSWLILTDDGDTAT